MAGIGDEGVAMAAWQPWGQGNQVAAATDATVTLRLPAWQSAGERPARAAVRQPGVARKPAAEHRPMLEAALGVHGKETSRRLLDRGDL